MTDAPKKHKYGDVHPVTGRVFHQYSSMYRNGERWITKEAFETIRKKKAEFWKSGRSKRRTKEEAKAVAAKWRSNPKNRESVSLKIKLKRKTDPKFRRRINAHERMKMATNPQFALSKRIRARLGGALAKKGLVKIGRTIDFLGCSYLELKCHIENLFVDGMTWENRNLWHIDHIIPMCSAETLEDVFRLSHYSNLQPLWAMDNYKKNSKMPNSH